MERFCHMLYAIIGIQHKEPFQKKRPWYRRYVYVSVSMQFQLLRNLFLLVWRANTLRSVGQQIRGQQSDGNRQMPESEVRRVETDETGKRRMFCVSQMESAEIRLSVQQNRNRLVLLKQCIYSEKFRRIIFMNSTFLSEETTRYYEDMWIAKQLKELSKGRYYFSNDQVFGKSKKEFWSII